MALKAVWPAWPRPTPNRSVELNACRPCTRYLFVECTPHLRALQVSCLGLTVGDRHYIFDATPDFPSQVPPPLLWRGDPALTASWLDAMRSLPAPA